MKKIIVSPIVLLSTLIIFFSCTKKEILTNDDISKSPLELKQSKELATFSNDMKAFNAAFKHDVKSDEKLNEFASKIATLKTDAEIQQLFKNCFHKGVQLFGLYKKVSHSSDDFITLVKQNTQLGNKDLVEMLNATFSISNDNSVTNSIFDCDDRYNLDNNNCLSTYNTAIINCATSSSTGEQHIQCTNSAYSAYLVCLSNANRAFLRCRDQMEMLEF
jgi:hypothetical protein